MSELPYLYDEEGLDNPDYKRDEPTSTKSNELRKCPFCGIVPEAQSYITGLYVTCENNDCTIAQHFTIASWNQRPIEDGLQARIDEGVDNERAIVNAATLLSKAGIDDPDGTLIGMVKNACERIATLEAQLRWIPVSEKRPPEDSDDIVMRKFHGKSYWFELPNPPEEKA
jgi:hypothetical protein